MTKISVVDISDPDKIQEILSGEGELEKKHAAMESDNDDGDSDDEDSGIIPRLLFGTLSTVTILVPLVSVHIALDIMVHQQYAEDFDAVEIAARAGTAAIGNSYDYTSNNIYSASISNRGCASA